MAHFINNPVNNFVRFGEGLTVGNFRQEVELALPVYAEDDYRFIFNITGTLAEIDNLVADPSLVEICLSLDRVTVARNWTVQDSLFCSLYRVNETTVQVAWAYGFPDFISLVSKGSCFYVVVNIDGAFAGGSNRFIRVPSVELTVLVVYGSDDDAFGYSYCGFAEFTQSARVPAYIGSPVFKTAREIYTKANGDTKVITSKVSRAYQFTTEFLPEEIHWAVNVAFTHQHVRVVDGRYDMGVTKDGEYEIEWAESFHPVLATAKTKLIKASIPDSYGTGCGCPDIIPAVQVACYDVDTLFTTADYKGTAQVQVVSNCSPINYSIVGVEPGITNASFSLSQLGLLTFTVGVGYGSVRKLAVTVKVSCGGQDCLSYIYTTLGAA